MKRLVPVFIVFVMGLALIPLGMTSGGAVNTALAAEQAGGQVDMEAAKATFESTCSKCHATSRALGKKKDQAGWENTVSRMSSYHARQKGGPISDEDQKAIVQHLLENAGK